MYCQNCGNEIKNNELYCKNCGNKINKENKNNDNNPSLILAIISCVLFWLPILSIPLAIVAIILAITNKKNRLVSIIISLISIILTIIVIAIILLLLSTLKSTIPDNYGDTFKRIIEEEPQNTKSDIKGYSWENKDKETVYFNNDFTYKWIINDDIKEGSYSLYNGETAISYISEFLKEFNITEEEQKSIIDENKIDLSDYYLLILRQKGDNKTTYYYGYIDNDDLYLTDIANNNKIELTRKERISNADI